MGTHRYIRATGIYMISINWLVFPQAGAAQPQKPTYWTFFLLTEFFFLLIWRLSCFVSYFVVFFSEFLFNFFFVVSYSLIVLDWLHIIQLTVSVTANCGGMKTRSSLCASHSVTVKRNREMLKEEKSKSNISSTVETRGWRVGQNMLVIPCLARGRVYREVERVVDVCSVASGRIGNRFYACTSTKPRRWTTTTTTTTTFSLLEEGELYFPDRLSVIDGYM